MTSAGRNVFALLRLEMAESLRSKWFAFTFVAYALVLTAFVWLGLSESRVLGFTGITRVVLNLTNLVIVAIPLMVLVATSQSIVRARRSGLLEMLLSQPCRRSQWFTALLLSRAAMLIGPILATFGVLTIATLFLGVEEGFWILVARCFAISIALVWAFIGIGLWLSSVAQTAERAIVYALGVWLVVSLLHDFALLGAMLHTPLPPRLVFVLAAANPSESARIGILSSVDPELSVLGPVGFWLSNSLGARVALALGVGWPVLVGTAALLAANRRLTRGDVTG